MPVPTVITDLSSTAASNYPAGSDAPSTLDDVQRAHAGFIRNLLDATQTQAYTAFTTGGTTTAYTLTPTPALTALAAGQRFRVKFNAANTSTTPTLAISGLTAKSIKVYDTTGAKTDPAVGFLALNMLIDLEYDGTDYVALNLTSGNAKSGANTDITSLSGLTSGVSGLGLGSKIQPITASVAASALTVTINPTTLDFRSATLTSGAVNTRVLATAASMVVSSGSTLGTVSATAARIAVLALDNAGTVEVGVVNLAGGVNLDETGVISTTAEGGAGAADSAGVVYSTTARTGVAYRVVGFLDMTQATAGTYATAPSTIQGAGGQALAALASVGYGQTWQDVTGSRVASTQYYNLTGKPIMVAITTNDDGNFDVNGVTYMRLTAGTSARGAGSLIIPPGARYSFSNTALYWAELR